MLISIEYVKMMEEKEWKKKEEAELKERRTHERERNRQEREALMLMAKKAQERAAKAAKMVQTKRLLQVSTYNVMYVAPNFTALNNSTGDKGTHQTRCASPVSPPEKQHVDSSHPDETEESGTYSCTATCSVWLTLIVIFISLQNV